MFPQLISLPGIFHLGSLVLGGICWLLLYVLIVFGYGRLVLEIISPKSLDRLESFILSSGLGMGVVGHLMLALGAAGLLYALSGWIVAGVGAGLAIYFSIREFRGKISRSVNIHASHRAAWLSAILIFIILLNLSLPFLSDALLPPINNDEIAYHLPIPKIYNSAHQIVYIPFIPYSNWPLEAEMLFGLGLLLSSEVFAHLVSWAALLVLTFGIYSLAKTYGRPLEGLVAAALLTSVPMVRSLAGLALIEPLLTLFTFLAVYTLLRWLSTGRQFFWILSAVFAGLAASTKFNAALTPALLGLVYGGLLLMRGRTHQIFHSFKGLMAYGLIAFAVVFPWYLKSWLFTGSPLWSFFPQIFPIRGWDALGSEYLIGFIQKNNFPVTLSNWLGALAEVTLHPIIYGGWRVSPGIASLVLVPFWFAGLFLARPGQKKVIGTAIVLAVLLYTAWFFTTAQSRFLLPAIPVFTFLSTEGLVLINQRASRWQQMVLSGVLVVFLISVSWIANPADRSYFKSQSGYLFGKVDRETFLSQRISGYPAIEYINKNLPEDAYLLMGLYEVRGYYLERRYFWANPLNQRVLQFETLPDSAALSARLEKAGFTYILYNTKTIDWFNDVRYGSQISSLFKEFLRTHGRLVLDAGDLQLYQFVP